MTIAATDVSSVPVSRVLRVIGLRGYWSFGETFTCPSPMATAKKRRDQQSDLRVTKAGTWSDYTGRTGLDMPALVAYLDGSSRAAALRKLAEVLSPRDLTLNRCIRAGDTERAGPAPGEDSEVDTTSQVSDARLRKFASHGTPRTRAAALLQVATNAVAADRAEDRRAGRR
jgi:hypothetical protein